MNDITALAQSHELLIANGNETARLLRHLANNEIDSDYFAVVSECESYGQETEAELSITDFALRAAGYVDALVEALEKAQRHEKLTEAERQAYLGLISQRDERIASLESRTVNEPQSDYFASLVAMARVSADKAMRKFPQPNYVLLKVAEEAGEVVQAGVHYAEKRMEWEQVEGEIVQLLAMLIRLVTEGDQINGITPPAAGIQVIEGEGQ
ncbi:hypothetical protein AB9B48_14955 [Kluyvera ascorbata]|uniref:hypothetical protein n=1 Tax=Kluyvera ascorbata TaxID=51288 RepID=UPI00350F16D3